MAAKSFFLKATFLHQIFVRSVLSIFAFFRHFRIKIKKGVLGTPRQVVSIRKERSGIGLDGLNHSLQYQVRYND